VETRHNLGAAVVATIAARHDVAFKRIKRSIRADAAELHLGAARLILARPNTFMNVSGQAVAPLVRYFNIDLASLVVAHDDIDLPLARLRLQYNRGSGGNNGARSIIGSLGSQGFWRLKCGVGRPPGRMDPADFVLRRFTKKEQPEIDLLIQRAADVVELFVTEGSDAARQATGDPAEA